MHAADAGENQKHRAYHGEIHAKVEKHGARQLELANDGERDIAEGAGQEGVAEQPATTNPAISR